MVDWDIEGSWNHDVTQIKREGRGQEAVLKVADKESAKTVIEILNMGIAIQELVSSENVRGLDMLYLTKQTEEKTLERVIIRMKNNMGVSIVAGEFTWDITTSRSKSKRSKKMEGTLAQQVAKFEMRIEGIVEEERSNNKTMARKMAKKSKRVLRKDGTSLFQMED